MLDIHYLQDEIKRLLKKKESLTELIRRQSIHLILMSESDLRRDEIQYQLEERQTELEEVKDQMASSQRLMLYKSLMSLDYHDHTNLFQNFSRTYHVGAFMLHGSIKSNHHYRGYSVRALLKRLVYITPNSGVTPLMHRDLSSPIQSNDVDALWRALAAEVKLGPYAKREDIIKRICRRLQAENVILVFRGVDFVPEECLRRLIQDFWGPLATEAQKAQHSGRFLLLMFLVDYSGRVKDWEIACAEWPDEGAWKPDIPIRLPIVARFSNRDLSGWMEQWSETLFDILPDDLKQGPLEYRIQNILNKSSNGDPDLVMWYICNRCGHLLEGAEECLRL